MIASHCAVDADVTVACIPVEVAEASAFGVVTVDADGAHHRLFGEADRPKAGSRGSRALPRLDGDLRLRESAS